MSWRPLLPLSVLLMPLALAAGGVAAGKTGLLGDVRFTEYSTDASSAELARRLVSPLKVRLQQQADASHVRISEQPIDLGQERFALYVPLRTNQPLAMHCWYSCRPGHKPRFHRAGYLRWIAWASSS